MRVSPVCLLTVVLAGSAGALRAQDTTGRDTTRRDSTSRDTTVLAPLLLPIQLAPPPPAPPAPAAPPPPEQQRYLDGLRTAARGVAQLRDGIDRVMRTQQESDTLRQRRAGRRLGGLCAAANSFITNGRAKMQPTAYEDSLRIAARQLVVRIDALSKALPACERTAGREPTAVATDLTKLLRAYEEALAAFRTGLAAARVDSTKTVSQQ